MLFAFFFFKQKTAYEMRISDWSSDVCSSDLQHIVGHPSQQIRAGVTAYAAQEHQTHDSQRNGPYIRRLGPRKSIVQQGFHDNGNRGLGSRGNTDQQHGHDYGFPVNTQAAHGRQSYREKVWQTY